MNEVNNLTLDPEKWADFRKLAHEMVDDMVDHLSELRDRPVWQPMPGAVRETLSSEPLPLAPQGERAAYEQFRDLVLPYPSGNLHARFYGWVQGNGVPLANMADMLASAMNPHLAGAQQAPVLVEEKVIAWLAEVMDFHQPQAASSESGGDDGEYPRPRGGAPGPIGH